MSIKCDDGIEAGILEHLTFDLLDPKSTPDSGAMSLPCESITLQYT